MATKKKPKGLTAEPKSATPVAPAPTTTPASPTPAPAAAHSAADVAIKPTAETPAAKTVSYADKLKKSAATPAPAPAAKASGGTGGAGGQPAATTTAAPAKTTTAAAPAAPAAVITPDDAEWRVNSISADRKKHILERHGSDAETTDAGHFAGDWGEISELIYEAVDRGNYYENTGGVPGYVFEWNCGDVIGWNRNDRETRWIRVIVSTSGNVITAFPT